MTTGSEDSPLQLLPGVQTNSYHVYDRDGWSVSAGPVVEESLLTIYVNGREFVTMMATPAEQDYLAVGFLYTEGLIHSPDDLRDVRVARNRTCIDVWLRQSRLNLPKRRIFTSGCGKGVTFEDRPAEGELPPLESDLRVSHDQLAALMHALQSGASLYRHARGVHAAGLATPDRLLMLSEDVGRHNTLDKLAGRCLLEGIDPADHILLTSGRISSEMIKKARRLLVPIVASRTSPTSLSVQLARAWGITLVGYLRPERMQVYANPERLSPPPAVLTQQEDLDHES